VLEQAVLKPRSSCRVPIEERRFAWGFDPGGRLPYLLLVVAQKQAAAGELGGIISPMATPFHTSGGPQGDAVRAQVRWLPGRAVPAS
jgi:hypothetical protein